MCVRCQPTHSVLISTFVVMALWPSLDERPTASSVPSALLQHISDLDASEVFVDPQVQQLCAAIEANDAHAVNDMISAGVDVNAVGIGNATPLLWALPPDRSRAFQALLEAGADPNVKLTSDVGTKGFLKSGDTVTLLTTRRGTVTQLRQVMEHGGDPQAVDAKFGDSLIHAVIKAGGPDRKEKIAILIEHGAPLNSFSNLEVTPVMLAVTWGGQYDVALQLLEAGADYRVYKPKSNSKLVHKVVTEEGRLRQNGPAQKQDYEKLKAWLEVHGESLDAAREDERRWSEWPEREFRFRMDVEIKERIDRDKARVAADGVVDDAQIVPRNDTARGNHNDR